MNRTNELTAAFSLGVSLTQIMGVILSLVFIISCFSLILQDRILPPFYRKKTVHYWREMKGMSRSERARRRDRRGEMNEEGGREGGGRKREFTS